MSYVGPRGRQGGIPVGISRKAEDYQRSLRPPYDADDIISAFESGYIKGLKENNMEKVLQALKRFGAAIASFIIIFAWIGGTFGIQVVSWSAKLHPGESWWALGISGLIISSFAFWPSFQTAKYLVKIAMDQ